MVKSLHFVKIKTRHGSSSKHFIMKISMKYCKVNIVFKNYHVENMAQLVCWKYTCVFVGVLSSFNCTTIMTQQRMTPKAAFTKILLSRFILSKQSKTKQEHHALKGDAKECPATFGRKSLTVLPHKAETQYLQI